MYQLLVVKSIIKHIIMVTEVFIMLCNNPLSQTKFVDTHVFVTLLSRIHLVRKNYCILVPFIPLLLIIISIMFIFIILHKSRFLSLKIMFILDW